MPSYKTTVIIDEDGFGQRTDVLIVSDTSAGLTDVAGAVEVEILAMDSTAEDLDDGTGIQSPHELQFSIIGSAVLTDDDQAAYDFVLAARDVGTKRFIARLINPQSPVVASDFAFRGVVAAGMSATDLKWSGGEYSTAIQPLREWSCTATSFDAAAVLDKDVKELADTIVSDTAWIAANVQDRLAYFYRPAGVDAFGHREVRFAKLVGLDVLLQKLLDAASAGSGVTFTFVPTFTDFIGFPAHYQPYTASDGRKLRYCLVPRENYSQPPIPYKTYPIAYFLQAGGNQWGSIFVSWRLLTPTQAEERFSWLRYKSVAELLYNLAWGLGMFVDFTYTTPTTIEVRLKRRGEIVSQEVFLRDMTEAKLDIAPIPPAERRSIVGNAMELCREGAYQYVFDGGTVQNWDNARPLENGDMLPLTISPTWCLLQNRGGDAKFNFDDEGVPCLLPHNAVFYESPGSRAYLADSANGSDHWQEYNREGLHTAIYIKAQGRPDSEGEVGVEDLDVWLPIVSVWAGPLDAPQRFETLASYVSHISAWDDAEYEQTYEITVPGVCCFRTAIDGEDDWRNLQLGCFFTLDGLRYVVVSIERKLLETRIRVHRASRFSDFVVPTGVNEPEEPVSRAEPLVGEQSRVRRTMHIQAQPVGEEIPLFSAVVKSNELLYVAKAEERHYDQVIGLAITGSNIALGVDHVEVQTSGRITVGSLITGAQAGDRIFLRSGTPNLSKTPLTGKNGSENYYLELGLMESPTVFLLKKSKSRIYE